MTQLAVILGDQLSPNLSALQAIDRTQDVVLMMEVMAEATYVPHHKQKIVLILSAMRHFAEELRAAGYHVDYVRLDDPMNGGSFARVTSRPSLASAPAATVSAIGVASDSAHGQVTTSTATAILALRDGA